MQNQILKAQKYLKDHQIDGWLLYNFQNNNPLALEFLKIPEDKHLSRRFFYWIPQEGTPIKVVHQIEMNILNDLPGETFPYAERSQLQKHMETILKGAKSVAMEYSFENHLPYISKLDAGTKEWIEEIGPVVTSSGPFLQYFTCLLDDDQMKSHREAATYVDRLGEETFQRISQLFLSDQRVNEYEVQQWMVDHMHNNGYVCQYRPTVAFAEHTSDPHYSPTEKSGKDLKAGDLVLLDIMAKQQGSHTIYADITRMAINAKAPSDKQAKVYEVIRGAQQATFDFIKRRFELGEIVKGFEADEISRDYLVERGYGSQILHRTGHNIYQVVHGPGAHLDSFETQDDRPLIPSTAFTIEPGIYFPGDFGCRVEFDVLIHPDSTLEITSGVQDHIRSLL